MGIENDRKINSLFNVRGLLPPLIPLKGPLGVAMLEALLVEEPAVLLVEKPVVSRAEKPVDPLVVKML